jgi:hypothetical protein
MFWLVVFGLLICAVYAMGRNSKVSEKIAEMPPADANEHPSKVVPDRTPAQERMLESTPGLADALQKVEKCRAELDACQVRRNLLKREHQPYGDAQAEVDLAYRELFKALECELVTKYRKLGTKPLPTRVAASPRANAPESVPCTKHHKTPLQLSFEAKGHDKLCACAMCFFARDAIARGKHFPPPCQCVRCRQDREISDRLNHTLRNAQ